MNLPRLPNSRIFLISGLIHFILLGLLVFFSLRSVQQPTSFKALVFFSEAAIPVDGSKTKLSAAIERQNAVDFAGALSPLSKKKVENELDQAEALEDFTESISQGQSSLGKTSLKDPSITAGSDTLQAGDGLKKLKSKGTAGLWMTKRDLLIYRTTLGKIVSSNWVLPPISRKKFQIVMEVLIDPKGEILEINKKKSSGLAILDAAAERAIRGSTPFPSFPSSFGDQKQFRAIFRFTPDQVLN
ncbi:MAG: TonB C-terminal domain-containing protein [Deltaproteobacteria bacterium]|nr:TonB C-terminal domain-containing protein [Deltaproteobacteria bacterium]